jgi:beta-lactamase family protein
MIVSLLLLILAGTMSKPAPAPHDRTLAGLQGSQSSRRLQEIVDRAVQKAIGEFAADSLDTAQIAVTLADVSRPRIDWASARGQVAIYPASVVKLFYLVAAHRWMEDRRLEDTEELRRAMHDMIIDSSNDATHYVLDVLTGTTSGPELSDSELAAWAEKRNAVNRYFATLGYTGINCNKKPWCEGPYGRETQASKAFEPSRNLLTTDATARLLAEIVLGRAVSPDRGRQMMELLARDPSVPSEDPDDQAHGFSAPALGPGMKLWSKAGWTSRVRHDAAYIETPAGQRFVLVTFTEGEKHANDRRIIAFIAREVLSGLEKK